MARLYFLGLLVAYLDTKFFVPERLFFASAVLLVGLVVVLGAIASLGFGALLASQLFGVGPRDPLTFGIVAGLLTGVALLAMALPALRATRADPLVALRQD